MTASLSVLPETAREEARYAELKRKLDELQRQFKLQEVQELASFEAKLKAIDEQADQLRNEITAQLSDSPIREKIEKVIREKRDLEAAEARRRYQEQKDERKKRYDSEKKRYKEEAYIVTTRLMKYGLGASYSLAPPTSCPREKPPGTSSQTVAASDKSYTAEPAPAEPSPTGAPSTPRESADPVSTEGTAGAASPPVDSRGRVLEDAPETPPKRDTRHSRRSPTGSQQPGTGDSSIITVASPLPSPADSSTAPEPATGQETPVESTISVANPLPVPKRKASGSCDDSSVSAPGHAKRPKFDKTDGPNNTTVERSPLPSHRRKAATKTISFEEVYGKPGEEPKYRHVIVQYPSGTGSFYILKCDEHGVHFGEHPLRGAAKHLASSQHGYMTKAHSTAIATLGYLVHDCTQELAEKNNAEVTKLIKDGVYKPFNANNLSQTRRAELGFPPLESPASQKTATQRPAKRGDSRERPSLQASPSQDRKQFRGVTDPMSCRFYVGCGSRPDQTCPVLILPWGDLTPAGLQGTLADTGIFCAFADDGKELEIPDLPKCYVYDHADGRIRGIKGWANGYERGGPLEEKREFPVLCVDNSDYRSWTLGWITASNLSPLDFDDPDSERIPFFREARDYFISHILCQRNLEHVGLRQTQWSPDRRETVALRRDHGEQSPVHIATTAAGDIEMGDAGSVLPEDVERSPVGHSSQTMANPDNGTPEKQSRRTSISNRSEVTGNPSSCEATTAKLPLPPALAEASAPISPVTNARIIAAQALGLQTPVRTGFTPINAPPTNTGITRSASASLEPQARTDRGSAANVGSQRLEGMRARSSSPCLIGQDRSAPAINFGQRSVDGNLTQGAPAIQSQGTTARKLSPASLENIVQDFQSESSRPQKRESQSPRPAPRPQPALFAVPDTPHAPLPRETRAGSAPVQQREPVEVQYRRAGSASAAPGPNSHVTPRLPALVFAQRDEQPRQMQSTPSPSTASPQLPQLATTPLSTPTSSALNTRANSPISLAQTKAGSVPLPPASLIKPEMPSPTTMTTTTVTQPSGGTGPPAPTTDVFDVAGFVEDGTELFAATVPGQFLRLVDDHRTGVIKTPPGAPVALVVDPAQVRVVERVPAQGGAVCVVKILYHDGSTGDGNGGQGRTQTLVFEKARSTASGLLNGVVHARRFCRRLKAWNPAISCPSPSGCADSVSWRPGDQAPSAASTVSVE